jgi:hypothetical protein
MGNASRLLIPFSLLFPGVNGDVDGSDPELSQPFTIAPDEKTVVSLLVRLPVLLVDRLQPVPGNARQIVMD